MSREITIEVLERSPLAAAVIRSNVDAEPAMVYLHDETRAELVRLRRIMARSWAIRHPVLSVALGVVLGMIFAAVLLVAGVAFVAGSIGDALVDHVTAEASR